MNDDEEDLGQYLERASDEKRTKKLKRLKLETKDEEEHA